jgi:hypothetical protein
MIFMKVESTFEPKVHKCVVKMNPTNFNFLFPFNYQYYDHSNYEREWCTFDKGKKTFEKKKFQPQSFECFIILEASSICIKF